MTAIATVILLALTLAVVIAVVSGPLRSRGTAPMPEPPRRPELEAAREAKYHEIRDAELDYRTGKLSPEDFHAIDGALRREAVEILNQIEAEGISPAVEAAGCATARRGGEPESPGVNVASGASAVPSSSTDHPESSCPAAPRR